MIATANSAGLVADSLFPAPVAEIESLMHKSISAETAAESDLHDTARATRGHLASGGHRVRAALGLDAGLRLGLSRHDALVIGATAELLHNASLVHDDLQDGAMFRRGAPTVFAAFGPEVAVLSGDLLLSSAYAAIAQFSRPVMVAEMVRLVHRRIARVIRGQCGDLSARNRPVTDLAHYEAIVAGKSGALLGLPLELALLGAGFCDSLGPAREAAESFGIGYQIIDDLEDAVADGPLALNILTVLGVGNTAAEADRLAREAGSRHLRFAAAAAQRLPRGSGELLGKLTRTLSERL